MRYLKPIEKKLLKDLLQSTSFHETDLENLQVEEMNDGGMGSLYIHSNQERSIRKMHEQLIDKQFVDTDGIPILVTVNIDQFGKLYELDIWKADFTPVIKYPLSD